MSALLDKSGWKFIWGDDFDNPDMSNFFYDPINNSKGKWAVDEWPNDVKYPHIDGTGDEEAYLHSIWSRDNLYIKDGHLHCTITKHDNLIGGIFPDDGKYYSAKYSIVSLKSQYDDYTDGYNNCHANNFDIAKSGFRFGMFEIRCRMASGRKVENNQIQKGVGTYSTFWLTGSNAWPPEVDVFEFSDYSANQRHFFSTDHWKGKYWPPNTSINCLSTLEYKPGYKLLQLTEDSNFAAGQLLKIEYNDDNWMIGKIIIFNQNNQCIVRVFENGIDPNTEQRPLKGEPIPVNIACTAKTGCINGNQWKVYCLRFCQCPSHYYVDGPLDLSDDFHTYTLVWTPNEYAWFFDGKEIKNERNLKRIANDCHWQRMDIIFGASVLGPKEDDTYDFAGCEMVVDYVKVYKPRSGPPDPPANSSAWNFRQFNGNSIDNTSALVDINTNNIAASKMSILDLTRNILYKGLDNRLWNFWWNGHAFVSNCVNLNVNDISGEITPTNNATRIYYIGKLIFGTFRLRYFINGTARSTSVFHCRPFLTIDRNDNLYYVGMDNNVYFYDPVADTSRKLMTLGNVGGKIEVSISGRHIYYKGTDSNLWIITFRAAPFPWTTPQRLTSGANVTNSIIADKVSDEKVFYVGLDNRVWNCFQTGNVWYDYTLTWDAKAANVAGDLVSNHDSSMLYYRSIDNTLWYFFTDKGWSSGAGRWYNTKAEARNGLKNSVGGPIAVKDDGTVYYRGTDNKLYQLSMEHSVVKEICYNSPEWNQQAITLY